MMYNCRIGLLAKSRVIVLILDILDSIGSKYENSIFIYISSVTHVLYCTGKTQMVENV